MSLNGRTVVYCGNFEPRHSTENDIYRALHHLGANVNRIQENLRGAKAYETAAASAIAGKADLVLWTRTVWPWHQLESSLELAYAAQRTMLQRLRDARIPVVGYHLDRWWGLEREHLVHEEPFFSVPLLCTADGGHREQWEKAGVNHVWFPPAVGITSEFKKGRFRPEFFSDVAFVGNWFPGYHANWGHRRQLVDFLEQQIGAKSPWDMKFWPRPGEHAVRNDDLWDLYRSGRVFVGDSCLVSKPDGAPMTHYCSDRVPETIGRGGFLIHPEVYGVTYGPDAMYRAGEHLISWPLGDWDRLRDRIDEFAMDDRHRIEIAEAGRAHTLSNHTYVHRMTRLFEVLEEERLL